MGTRSVDLESIEIDGFPLIVFFPINRSDLSVDEEEGGGTSARFLSEHPVVVITDSNNVAIKFYFWKNWYSLYRSNIVRIIYCFFF